MLRHAGVRTKLLAVLAIPTVLLVAATTLLVRAEASEGQAYLLVGAAGLGLLVTVSLAVALAARITRPLRRLTLAATQVGEELPRMVARMLTPGDGPGVHVEPIAAESRDEIGQLAEAFNTVNEITVRVAGEQAALRASIAEMFVNVARRNQVLLGRQLANLDRMEAGEEDPATLDDLFKLDHLATRMRRNAESLLVLAGIDATRRLRRAQPLSDVIRTAVGEIEAYDRVDLSMTEDRDVSAHLALPAAHLLAELLENATHFSNPDTRVVVSAVMHAHSVDLTITDTGLGMSTEQYAAANATIVDPPIAEIAVSQRVGMLVVGRLAARLGATVELRPGASTGTVVAVALPHTVFEGMAAPLVFADEAAAEATDEVPDAVADAPSVVVVDEIAAEVVAAEVVPDEVVAAAADEVVAEAADEVVADEAVEVVVEVAEPTTQPGFDLEYEYEHSYDVTDELTAKLAGHHVEDRPTSKPRRKRFSRKSSSNRADVVPPAVDDADDLVAFDAAPDEAHAGPPAPAAEELPYETPDETPVETAVGTSDDEPVELVAEMLDDDAVETAEHAAEVTGEAPPVRRRRFTRHNRRGLVLEPVAEAADETVAEVVEVSAEPVVDVGDTHGEPVAEVVERVDEPVVEPDGEVIDEPIAEVVPVPAPRHRMFSRGAKSAKVAEPIPDESVSDDVTVDESITEAADAAAVDTNELAEALPAVLAALKASDDEPAPSASWFSSELAAAVPAPEAFPEHQPQSQPEPQPQPQPQPEPARPLFVYAPAVDILPGGPMKARPAKSSRKDRKAARALEAANAASAPVVPAAPTAPASIGTAPQRAASTTAPPVTESAAPATVFAPAQPVPSFAADTFAAPDRPPAEAPDEPVEEEAVPVVAAAAPVEPQSLAQRAESAQLHSDALSELRGLYEPTFTPSAGQAAAAREGLTRRSPAAAATAVADAPAAPRPERDADKVRGMLSGFRAGVERGRDAEGEKADPPSEPPSQPPAEAPVPDSEPTS